MKNHSQSIQFGVISDGLALYAWQELVIKKLISQADIKLSLVLINSNSKVNTPSNSFKNKTSTKSPFLWNLFLKYRVKKKSRALQEVTTNLLFEKIPQIYTAFSIDKNGLAELDNSSIIKLENARLDFIINFSIHRFIGKVISVANYGVWCYQFGDPEKYKGSSLCFWEIYNEDLVTRACLMRLTNEQDHSVLLKDGYLKTNILFVKNIDKIHFECTSWPQLLCWDIRNNKTGALSESYKIKPYIISHPPGNLKLLNFFLKQLKQFIKKAFKSLFYTDYWNIGIAHGPIQEFLKPEGLPEVKWFPNLPKYRFMADPFGMYFKDELYVIYEDFCFDQGTGKIASFRFEKDSFIENNIVIDEKFHMSYPFLLEYDGEIYCIPETSERNQVRLYKAVNFPNTWKLEKVLIDDYAGVDNTVFKYEDTWYMFSTNKNDGPHHNLNIHYSSSIFGPWQAHPKNPVKTDVRSARPAGTMFIHNGGLFRPSMDYSEKIEGRIVINKIVNLTTNEFNERRHIIINPFQNTYYADKVHTLSQVGPYTLVDGAKELFVFSNFKAFKYKIGTVLLKLKNK